MATQWDNWWASYKRSNPKAVINAATRDKFRAWQAAQKPTVTPGGSGTPQAAGPTEPAPAPAAPPKPPTFAPDYMDEQGRRDYANLEQDRATARNNAQRAYDLGLAEVNARQPGIERNMKMDLERNASNAAARGMFRSGARIVNAGRINTEGNEALTGLQRQRDQLGFDRDRAFGEAETGYTRGTQNIYTDSARRGLERWRQENGL